jgi:hypothetical protein
MSGSGNGGNPWRGWTSRKKNHDAAIKHHGKRKLALLAIPLIIIVLLISSYFQAMQVEEGTYDGPGGDIKGWEHQTTTTAVPIMGNKANILIGFKSSGGRIPGGANAESISFVVRSIDLRSGGEWRNAYVGTRRIDIMRYSNDSGILVQTEFPTGDYDILRLNLTDGSCGITNSIFYIYTPKTYTLDLPEGYIVVNKSLSLKEGDTTSLVLTFDIPSSVSRIGAGYAMDPKVTVTQQTGFPLDYVLI